MITTMEAAKTPGRSRRVFSRAWHSVVRGWQLFTAFRRTRPFWGGLWLMLGGYIIVHFARFPIALAIQAGFNATAGYMLGGGLILFGLVAWFAPFYSKLVGILGVLVALAAFVGANLGGFLLGTILGILGGSMVWGWGEKSQGQRQSESSRNRLLIRLPVLSDPRLGARYRDPRG